MNSIQCLDVVKIIRKTFPFSYLSDAIIRDLVSIMHDMQRLDVLVTCL